MKNLLAALLLSLVATTANAAEHLLFGFESLWYGEPNTVCYSDATDSGLVSCGYDNGGGYTEYDTPFDFESGELAAAVERNDTILMNFGDGPEWVGGTDYDCTGLHVTKIKIDVICWVDYPGDNDLYIFYISFYGDSI